MTTIGTKIATTITGLGPMFSQTSGVSEKVQVFREGENIFEYPNPTRNVQPNKFGTNSLGIWIFLVGCWVLNSRYLKRVAAPDFEAKIRFFGMP